MYRCTFAKESTHHRRRDCDIFMIAFAAGVAVFFSPLLTHYVESDAFRTAMEQQTAKGLHFPRARYAPIRRTGPSTAQSDSFEADNEQKAMATLASRDFARS